MGEVVVGIDPGLDGAIAFVPCDGSTFWVIDMPTVTVTGSKRNQRHVEPALLAAEIATAKLDHRLVAVVEAQHAMPGQGVSSCYTIGEGYGMIVGVLAALHIQYSRVAPAKWKRDMGLPTGADKDSSRAMALRLWPALAGSLGRKRDHGRAEALLIAKWYMRSMGL
jgi:crossover junction endodeoxyribonuclease RuvC